MAAHFSRVVCIDSGGSRIRAGFSGEEVPRVDAPNATARIRRQLRLLVADEVETKVKDQSQLFYYPPVDHGVVTDVEMQELIFSRVLRSPAMLGGLENVTDSALLLSVFPLTQPSCLTALDEVVFETLGFAAYARTAPQALAVQCFRALGHNDCGLSLSASGTGVIVDVGHSATIAMPFINWLAHAPGITRLDVGGKLLTNSLKEALSYRQFNLMDDTALVQQAKESLCYVAQDFAAELAASQRLSAPGALTRASARALTLTASVSRHSLQNNPKSHSRPHPVDDGCGVGIRRDFVLPDYITIDRGFVRGGAGDPTLSASAMVEDLTPPAADDGPADSGASAEAAAIAHLKSSLLKLGGAAPLGGKRRKVEEGAGAGDVGKTCDSDDYGDVGRSHMGVSLTQGGAGGFPTSLAAALESAQAITLAGERISVPEALFHPVNAGVAAAGLPASIASAIAACAPSARPTLWASIVLTGGGATLPGLEARLTRELSSLAPSGCCVRLYTPPAPAIAAWRGASFSAARPEFHGVAVTKAQWHEEGAWRCGLRLASAAASECLGGLDM